VTFWQKGNFIFAIYNESNDYFFNFHEDIAQNFIS
jgi:hypothetical protein